MQGSKQIRAVTFLLFCGVFHLSAFAVLSDPLMAPVAGWIVVLAAMPNAVLSYRHDRVAFSWSLACIAFCMLVFAVANTMSLSALTVLLSICLPLLAMQTGICIASLRMLNQLQPPDHLQCRKSSSLMQLLVATSVFSAAMVLLRNLPPFFILSPAWISYAIFTVNLVLVSVRITAALESRSKLLRSDYLG